MLTTALYDGSLRAERRITRIKLLSAMRFGFGGHVERAGRKT